MRRSFAFGLLALLLILAPSAEGAILFLESGSDATFGLEFYTGTIGLASSDNAIAHTGPRSIKLLADSGGGTAAVQMTGVLVRAGSRLTHWFYLDSTPADILRIVKVGDTGNGTAFTVGLDASRIPTVWDSAGGSPKSGGSAVAVTTWTRMTVSMVDAFPNFTIKVFINGTLAVTATQADFSQNARFDNLELAWRSSGGASDANKFLHVDDIYVDDGSGLDDPGDIRVTAKRPAANNTNAFNTAVGANPANRWTNVNERPLSETNGWEDTTALGDQENYGLETAAAGDVDVSTATLVARGAWVWAKISAASVLSKIMDNGTESAVTLTTTSALYTLYTASASYPSNAAGIGMRSSTTPNTFLYECGTLIAYTPAAAGAVRHRATSF